MERLNSQIESQLIEAGASLVGFADISGLPAVMRDHMKSAISIAVALDVAVVGEISEGPTRRYYHEYKRVNEFLSCLSGKTVDDLEKRGHNARAIDPTIRIEGSAWKALATPLPHKTVATLAGLGWIGKSALLITQRYGPAVRLATVLTDARLDAGTPVDDSRCGDCTKCVERCPAKAIVGENWQKGSERESIYDAHACRAMATNLAGRMDIPATICGICIHACPWTQKYISRQTSGSESAD
ncbi:MAG: epoxyqueuosine reductase [Phycisphaerales bacterium]|nr:MAG: epoxyqueuosine reductase [Phycisphaerales bacterium]